MNLPTSEDFEIIGTIEQIKPIAVGSRIREIARLRKVFGAGRWRKLPPDTGGPLLFRPNPMRC
jgi:hypothetical protein